MSTESSANSANVLFSNHMEDELLKRITLNPKICFGKPTIRNMRYPVETMLDLLSAGMTTEEILEDYPDLEKEDLQACLKFKIYENKLEQYSQS